MDALSVLTCKFMFSTTMIQQIRNETNFMASRLHKND